jgi:hypothetical protein
MIKSIKELQGKPVEIDLTGPNGNVFCLISIATDLAKILNKRRDADYFDIKALQADMMSADYEHAIAVMEKNFGHMIIMYR